MPTIFDNPFRPGAGHRPPYLAGRTVEQDEMKQHLRQTVVTRNVILTGLRGVGKTVLLETFRPIALTAGWLWVGADLSEAASVTEETLAIRLLADIALVTSAFVAKEHRQPGMGFVQAERTIYQPLGYETLKGMYESTPGLSSDKLKTVLEFVWSVLPQADIKGVVFAYDEAQNLADHAHRGQYPLSLLLEVFQSLQRKEMPFLLVLTGLPTLFPKLVESRTYAERMFHIMFLKQLDAAASRDAIVKPVEDSECPIKFTEEAVNDIINMSGGYPYFIQYICKEVYDVWIAKAANGEIAKMPAEDIVRKLDTDFFQGRWSKVTDRQRELLQVISTLATCDDEFTVQEIVNKSKEVLEKGFGASQVNQMLGALAESGLVFKNRIGKYSLAVPLLSRFIRRQIPLT
ncbi:MAG: ATP-binding protein [Candidatus Accumulibacter sp.]|nr:ATP-binding protein [Accumulibacter sp.]